MYYVSDLLEGLLNATAVRSLVGNVIVDIGWSRSSTNALLVPLSRKCMGYPPVWLISRALDLSATRIEQAIRANPSALLVSLSTSLTDDLIDKDTEPNLHNLSLLYILLLKAGSRCSSTDSCDKLLSMSLDVATSVLEGTVSEYPLHIGSGQGANRTLCANLRRAADRIGLFHEAIASDLLIDLAIGAHESLFLTSLCREFGRWCCMLDDFLDVEQDLAAGDLGTFPIQMLLQARDRSGKTQSDDLTAHRALLDTTAFVDEMISVITCELAHIIDKCERHDLLKHALSDCFTILPNRLREARSRVASEYNVLEVASCAE
jgi:hypothetical protein